MSVPRIKLPPLIQQSLKPAFTGTIINLTFFNYMVQMRRKEWSMQDTLKLTSQLINYKNTKSFRFFKIIIINYLGAGPPGY